MKPGSLYDRIFGFLGQLIALNLLWIVCSLPVITAGASTPNNIIEEVQKHVRIKF